MPETEVKKRHKGHAARLGIDTILDYDSINDYRRRRAERLAARGIEVKKQYRRSSDGEKIKKAEIQRNLSHMDAPEGEEEPEQNKYQARRWQTRGGSSGGESGGGGGGHGNTRLPFGLCKRFGIEIGKDWTPKDAWDALAGKGITADGAYERLKRGEDPGTPDNPVKEETPAKKSVNVTIDDKTLKVYGAEKIGGKWALLGSESVFVPGEAIKVFATKKQMLKYLKEQGVEEFPDPETGEILNPKEMEITGEPTKSLIDDLGRQIDELKTDYKSWSKYSPYVVTGKVVDSDGRGFFKSFPTKGDMMHYLREKGVEEVQDPDTGETVNPVEMELPEKLFKTSKWDDRWYTAASIGLRDGRYAVVGTDMDGKKRKLESFSSLEKAKAYLTERGVSEDKIKMSPAMKKREKERLSWMTSDKKEYLEYEGTKFGDIRATEEWSGRYTLTASDENGKLLKSSFGSKTQMMKYLKDQGVEKAKIGDEFVNPQEYVVPKSIAKISDVDYQKLFYKQEPSGRISLWGKDLDGRDRRVFGVEYDESFEHFKDRMARSIGVDDSIIDTDDDMKRKIDDWIKEDEKKAKIKAEFESKAVTFRGTKYADLGLEKDRDGDLYVTGYDERGRKQRISTYYGDFSDVEDILRDNGIAPESISMSDELKKEYDDYKERTKEFDAKAVEIEGRKYVDVFVTAYDDLFMLGGYDKKGRKREIDRGSYKDISDTLGAAGKTMEDIDMKEEAKSLYEYSQKEEAGIASGEYIRMSDGHAYKDLKIRPAYGEKYSVVATDIKGEDKVFDTLTFEDAIDYYESRGVTDYKFFDENTGDYITRPTGGIRKVRLMRTPAGEYKVMATSGKDTVGEVFSTSTEDSARAWIYGHGIDASKVKTKGMNPNDDVPRTHTAKTLSKFDTHRSEQEDKYPVLADMTDEDKQKVVNMMTDVFQQGQFRMWRDGHFEEILDSWFKNTLETGTSGGATGEHTRRHTEEVMLGIKGHTAEEGEKYGYLGQNDDKDAFQARTARGYGGGNGVLYKFKKSAIKDRTTYTCGDSLDSSPEGRMDRALAGYAGDHPTYEGVSAMWGSELKSVLRQYDNYKSGKITFKDFLTEFSESCQDDYIECHYHGKLTIADVESITMSKEKLRSTFNDATPEKRKKMLTKLKENGIILQTCERRGGELEDGYALLREEFGLE